jgi:hypothetical protein
MPMRRQLWTGLAACALAVLMTSPAEADIAAFNAAVKANDYAKATAEAAATWPTLDKSRDDIGVIAREFGFAALVAGNYAAAQSFAGFAVEHETGEYKQIAEVLLRFSDYKASPSVDARARLLAALKARSTGSAVDGTTFSAASEVLTADYGKGNWKDARESAEIAAAIAVVGGAALLADRRRFELHAIAMDYLENRSMDGYRPFTELRASIAKDIEAAPNDKAAERLVPVYWEAKAWQSAIGADLESSRRWRSDAAGDTMEDPEYLDELPRFVRLTNRRPEACKYDVSIKRPFNLPSTRRGGFVGAVILQIDITADGRAKNTKILAAIPQEVFSETVLEGMKQVRFRPGKGWDHGSCKIEREKYVFTFQFNVG